MKYRMKWTELVTMDFVKLYGQHECLWNPAHANYKSSHERERAYAEIGEEFKKCCDKSLSLYEIKNKVKNLRTTYMQQINKIFEKSTPDYIYVPTLIWFDEMDKFLKTVAINRQSVRYAVLQQREVGSSTKNCVDPEILNNGTLEDHSDPLMPHSDEDIHYVKLEPAAAEPPSPPPEPSSAHPNTSKIKKKKFQFRKKRSVSSMIHKTLNPQRTQSAIEDEFDIYGKYIASQLRKMPLQKALRLQLHIQKLVGRARISDLSNP